MFSLLDGFVSDCTIHASKYPLGAGKDSHRWPLATTKTKKHCKTPQKDESVEGFGFSGVSGNINPKKTLCTIWGIPYELLSWQCGEGARVCGFRPAPFV